MNTRARRNLDQLIAVCALLEPLLDRFVLVGGCATGLLITDPGAPDVRATVDVDLIVDVLSKHEYAKLEAEMRKLGFQSIRYVSGRIASYLRDDDFVETLPWHLPPDEAGQGRLPILRDRLTAIADLSSP